MKVETQIANHFANLKIISQSAISTISNTPSALVSGAKSGFDAASRNTLEFWQSLGAKVTTDKMSDDLRDYANHAKGSMGLCSRCEKFPLGRDRNIKRETFAVDLKFETPLERLLYHSSWCRLCGFLLRNLCMPGNDPFRHLQVAKHLQPKLQGKSFGQFVDSGVTCTDEHWPFGYGKELHEGAFNHLDPVASRHRYKKQAVVASNQLIPMMINVATTSNRNNEHEDLVHPLKCTLQITIHPNSDRVQASLLGYGRGFGAQMATLSQFNLRIQSEPSIGSTTTSLRYSNLVDSGKINLNLGAMWLHECETNHSSHCSEQSGTSAVQAPPNLRLIDVRNVCVSAVPTARVIRFAALSYMHGNPAFETLQLTSSNMQQLGRKNGLTEYWHGVPTTVKDAITLVRAVGERYLWVDALCIVQDVDNGEKQAQIAAMDWIYAKALFTIIAADAQTSMSGLAGVRSASRNVKQLAVQIRPGVRLLTPLDAPKNLDGSMWNSRAWTFQEGLLSKRLLIFQGNQMLWHCRSFIAHEDMTAADKDSEYPPFPWLALQKQQLGTGSGSDGSIMVSPDQTTRIFRSKTFGQYTHLISQYTTRQLTHDDDILRALGGLLHVFHHAFTLPMRYGLPEILFDIALLWQPAEMLEVRSPGPDQEQSHFPSWSWAGWRGAIKYEEPFRATIDPFLGTLTRHSVNEDEPREERIRPLVRWYSKSHTSEELMPLNKTGLGVPLFTQLPPEGDLNKTSFSSSSSLHLIDLPPSIRANLAPHHLIFNTSISTPDSFSLGAPVVQTSDTAFNPHNPPLRFNILNAARKNVGTVLLDGEGPTRLGEREGFIVVAEGMFLGLDLERVEAEGGEWPLYVVFLVRWAGEREQGAGMARRLGVGRVEKGAWWGASPGMEVVCLG